MKKILTILIYASIFVACSNEEEYTCTCKTYSADTLKSESKEIVTAVDETAARKECENLNSGTTIEGKECLLELKKAEDPSTHDDLEDIFDK